MDSKTAILHHSTWLSSWLVSVHLVLNLTPITHLFLSEKGRMPHSPQSVSSRYSSQHPQARCWLPITRIFFLLKELFTVEKNTFLMRISICSVSWIIAHSAGFFVLSSFQKKWPLCRLKEQSLHTKYFQNPLEYTEMCQLFRGEDYPTVYGTNMIPKFPRWCLVAYCPTVKTSEFAQKLFRPSFQRVEQKSIYKD